MTSLAVGDLNDYLGPSQICIKPTSAPETEIKIDVHGDYFENETRLEKAHITLNDCLACSGCITSAESILVSMQTYQEVYDKLQSDPTLIPILSIAPQSLASLATFFHIEVEECLVRLEHFFKTKLGFAYVFDTTFARSLSLAQTQEEYAERSKIDRHPILASACPGWICYAEKTHGELLPFISHVKSPQAVMGTLVKDWLAPKNLNKTRRDIYHVTVMPCYDKKLEASRQDFTDEQGCRDVDCVLTTGEVLRVLQDHNYDLSLPTAGSSITNANIFPSLLTPIGTSSGSYLHSILALVVQSTSPEQLHLLTLTINPIRGSDHVEYLVKKLVSPEEIIFKGATCYGFRNLQNVVRRIGKERGLSTGRSNSAFRPRGRLKKKDVASAAPDASLTKGYDYVEVMACPSGCVNGGGQLPSGGLDLTSQDASHTVAKPTTGTPPANHIALSAVEAAYWSTEETFQESSTDLHPGIAELLTFNTAANNLRASVLRDLSSASFRTQYRAVNTDNVDGLAVRW